MDLAAEAEVRVVPDARWWAAVAGLIVDLGRTVAAPGVCDLRRVVVIVPSLLHAPDLRAALHAALAGQACVAPRVVTLEAWARFDPGQAVHQRAELFQALRQSSWVRERFGAQSSALWSLARDLADPRLWTERYHLSTWLDYARLRSRFTHADRRLQAAADAFGLSPISGDLPTVTGPPTPKIWLRPAGDHGLEMVHANGADQIEPYPNWREVALADRQALLIIGRGLHLDRPDPETISRGLSTQPCWGAIVPVEPGTKRPPPPPRRWRRRRG